MTLSRPMPVLMLCALCGAAGWFGGSARHTPARLPELVAHAEPAAEMPVVLAAPGRTEGASEPVNVSAGIDGVLSAVLVEEGQRVKAGDTIARVERPELKAELDQSKAAAETARQAKARLLRGSRVEERQQAAAEVSRARAALDQTLIHFNRQSTLLETGDVPRASFDRARGDKEVAEAVVRAALEREKLLNAPPLPEEVAKADAEIRLAEERIRALAAMIAKCNVRTPTGGTVVRRFMRAGEVVSVVFPQPIVSVVDASRMRVRAEVDERDIAHVRAGQPVLISADALRARKVSGRVASLGSLMGRKRVRTGDPAEKSDRDVLEVLVDLDEAEPRLVLGLRVTVQFLNEAAPAPAAVSRGNRATL